MSLQFLLTPLLVLAVSYSSCGESQGNTSPAIAVSEPAYRTVDSVKRMQIFTVNMRIMTPIQVVCEKFDSYFGEIQQTEITRKTEQDSVLKMLKETKAIAKTFSLTPDTRGTLAISYTNGFTETFCFGDQLIKLEDSTYYLSPSFKTYLYKISGTKMPATK